jgi:type IX secretion system PorP/SprF family membrane protein
MKWYQKIVFLIGAGILPAIVLHAQDLHFSQFFNSPLLVNPANTGFIPDGDYRIGGTYRNQWSSILQAPYKTMSLFGDAKLFKNRLENGWIGLGAVIISDVAGTGNLRTTETYFSLAYHQLLGNASLLTAGFNLGWDSKHIDQSKLTFPDQFNGTFFDVTIPTSAIIINNNVSYFDMQVGVNYAYFPDNNTYINGGISLQHVNQPRETFFTTGSNSYIPIRYIAFASTILKTGTNVIISPAAYYTTQANASELVGGLNLNYDLSGGGDKQLILGVYDRLGDAIIPVAGFQLNNIRFTFSYDVTTSALSNFNNLQGASELNILQKGSYSTTTGGEREVLCPKF